MDRKIHDYLEAGKALQRKYDELKFGKLTKQVEMVEKFKPITDSLQSLNTNLTKSVVPQSSSGKTLPYILASALASGKKIDKTFGVRVDNDGLHVGNTTITITPENNIQLDSDQSMYKGTPGLWELLTSENPQNYDRKDLSNYEQIILRSYAYKRNNDRHSKYNKSSRGQKYRNIIKPMLVKYHIVKSFLPPVSEKPIEEEDDYEEEEDYFDASDIKKEGSGLRKFNTNHPVEYVYWNNVDELIERLCHLWGEVQSGNSNPLLLNEIVNIIQEFREL
jgi:hypothetical protein